METRKYSHFNEVHITGYPVKDVFVNDAKTMASFRISKPMGQDKPSMFFGCVVFGNEQNPLPLDIIRREDKHAPLEITGHFRNRERQTKDGRTFQEPEIVVDSIALAPYTVEESAGGPEDDGDLPVA